MQGYLEPEDLPTDLETITDEERLVFRKMGLSMKPYLLVGKCCDLALGFYLHPKNYLHELPLLQEEEKFLMVQ